ncbi:E3 ubiquitin-protein ligase TRIM39 isoform X2 [Coregonus clupeaformis]|nr:E3 ubiquitin-protein ligase TRIM39 isoform X1 [Coregonus clupeaformis]XP_041723949.1 E3 ubiquitin-protein ligase TRIM39 isoform X2 [Coregonus clupeaformis]
MASLSMTEDQLRCSICLDIFVHPVSTPCGHNFCKSCISDYWDIRDPICPLCKETFKKRPDLHVNTFINEIINQFKSAQEDISPHPILPLREPEQGDTTDGGVNRKIQARQNKVEEIKHSVEISRASSQKDIEESEQVFTALLRSIERSQADVVGEIQEKQRAVEKQADWLIMELEQEIADLKSGNNKQGELRSTPQQICSEISASSGGNTIWGIVSQLEDTFREEMKKVMDKGLKLLKTNAVNVILDPDTAHPFLALSEDGKQARHVNDWRILPFNPKRFNTSISVLGRTGFSSRRFYFEVQVSGKTDWGLGVARESIDRKGKTLPTPAIGFWALWMTNGHEYKAAEDSGSIVLSLREKPQKVGVFVDHKEGLVSFYDSEAKAHIYSFTGCSFNEKLFPFLSSSVNDDDKNSAPFVILPVSHRG